MLQRLPKKVCSTFYTFSQHQKDMFTILFVVNSEIPACDRGTIRFLAHAKGIVKNVVV
jgi:hypothetical protein